MISLSGAYIRLLLLAAHRIADVACASIAAKVLKQRVHTVAKATDVCLAFIELEQGEAVVVRWRIVCGVCRNDIAMRF